MSAIRRTAAAACLVVALTACSGSKGGSSPSTEPTTGTTVLATTPGAATSPTASRAPDPNFDFGQTVFIEPGTVRPLQLVSAVHHAIVFRNDSGGPCKVVFDNVGIRSTVIPSGGTWAFTPKTMISLVYHVPGGPQVTGRIQVTQLEPA